MEYRSFDVILLYCQARSAFFEGDLEAYQLLVQQADKFIDEIEDLDTEFCKKYGECSLFMAPDDPVCFRKQPLTCPVKVISWISMVLKYLKKPPIFIKP